MIVVIYQIRDDHPTLGVRDLYFKIAPDFLGRDAFEIFCKTNGLMSIKKKFVVKTTNSLGVTRFENLIMNLRIYKIDQVWQSDITYFEVKGKFYYITFILDAFSRRIVGHSVSKDLSTVNTTLPALSMAIKLRRKQDFEGLIFHSDGGGQYYAKLFLDKTRRYNIQNSMCEYAWENGKAERINGVIKNNYLIHREINNFQKLINEVDRSVKLYNYDKPHKELKKMTPIAYENKLLNLL